MAQSIFERYGGFASVSRIVSEFYRKVVDSGPVIGSLVGVQRYVYDLFGPGVNLAARMETASEPMQITMTEDTAKLLADDFVLTEIGEAEIKGFGTQRLFRLESEVGSLRL